MKFTESKRAKRVCGRQYVSGGSDPYGTECTLRHGHDGAHIGASPFDSDGLRWTWNGGGHIAGDRRPVRNAHSIV